MSRRAYQRIEYVLILSTLFVLGAAFYLQYMGGLKPCPLCLVQRFCAFGFVILCYIGLRLPTPNQTRFMAIFQMLFAFAGLFFASRQLWLQSLPADQVPACLPGLDVLIHYFHWQDVFSALFWGTGECTDVKWTLLGFSMPFWSALYFLTMFLASGWVYFRLGASLAYPPRKP